MLGSSVDFSDRNGSFYPISHRFNPMVGLRQNSLNEILDPFSLVFQSSWLVVFVGNAHRIERCSP
jgi:hypothetical protein